MIMPRKKRIAIIVISIIIVLLIVGGVFTYLYLNTDMFKSNQTLFGKYFVQNFDVLSTITQSAAPEINQTLDENKYTSNLNATVEYIASKNTSDENKNNSINKAQLEIEGKTDKTSQYQYKDISLTKENDEVIRLELMQEENNYGVRLDGIKQFVSLENTGDLAQISENIQVPETTLQKIPNLFSGIDIKQWIDFTEEEKQILASTYLEIIKQNTAKEVYGKQSNGTITVDGKSYYVNAYSIEITKEQYNNIVIKVLEKMTTDEIILGKIDNIENKINEYKELEQEKTMREQFVEYLKERIQEIKDNNIGKEKTKITVYENQKKTIRTTIETDDRKIALDLFDNQKSIKLDDIKNENNTQLENTFLIKKSNENGEYKTNLSYEKATEGKKTYIASFEMTQKIQENKIDNEYVVFIDNQTDEATLKVSQEITLVDEFEDQIRFSEENNVTINSLEKEKAEIVMNILNENWKSQMTKIDEKIPLNDLNKMLINLGLAKEEVIPIEETTEVSETERNRFNSQFTFFIGEKLTVDNIKQLLETAKTQFEDAEIKQEKVSDSRTELKEIKLKIKRNTQNEEKIEELSKLLDENKNKKFNVTMSYDENTKLINNINIVVE